MPDLAALAVNGNAVPFDLNEGFTQLRRRWQPGDAIELLLPMPIRRVISHKKVEANRGRIALERGPLVYCVEGVDNGGQIGHITLPPEARLETKQRPDLLNGVTVIQGLNFTAIPYYAWAHWSLGEMAVWLRLPTLLSSAD